MGAICEDCNMPMGNGRGCTWPLIQIGERVYRRVPYLSGADAWPIRPYRVPDLCHDCGTGLGKVHHLGCDMEVCPQCGGQLISCACLDDTPEPVLA